MLSGKSSRVMFLKSISVSNGSIFFDDSCNLHDSFNVACIVYKLEFY